MPVLQPTSGYYPSIEDVFNSVRVHINDTFAGATSTVGEGRVFTDAWTPSITILNLAIQRLTRNLRKYGMPTQREVAFIINGLTPINGPGGLGIPDPSIQPYLSFGGYWDGSTLNTAVQLPVDLTTPLKIQQRITGSGSGFSELQNAPDGLPSVNQNYFLGFWEWRQDAIFFNGSQNTMDIQLTYKGGQPQYPLNLDPTLFPKTLIPILDSQEALSYRLAYIFCAPRLPKGGADELQANYEAAMLDVANQWVQTMQRTPVARREFETSGGGGNGWWSG